MSKRLTLNGYIRRNKECVFNLITFVSFGILVIPLLSVFVGIQEHIPVEYNLLVHTIEVIILIGIVIAYFFARNDMYKITREDRLKYISGYNEYIEDLDTKEYKLEQYRDEEIKE